MQDECNVCLHSLMPYHAASCHVNMQGKGKKIEYAMNKYKKYAMPSHLVKIYEPQLAHTRPEQQVGSMATNTLQTAKHAMLGDNNLCFG